MKTRYFSQGVGQRVSFSESEVHKEEDKKAPKQKEEDKKVLKVMAS